MHQGEYIVGSVQDCSNSSALAMELLQFCTEPTICYNQKESWLRIWNMEEQSISFNYKTKTLILSPIVTISLKNAWKFEKL